MKAWSSYCLAPTLLLCASRVLAQIQIDDSDRYSDSSLNGIQYSSLEWNDKNAWYAAQRHNGTYHNAELPGAHFTYFFRGSEIKYYADRDPKGGPINITLDGEVVANINGKPPTTAFQFQQLLWSVSALDSGDHQLVVTGVSGTFGLDWLEVTPVGGRTDARAAELGPGAFEVPTGASVVDDTNDAVTYSGSGWQPGSDGSGPAAYLGGTIHRTTNPGDSATFNFTGTDVWFFTDSMNGNAPMSISVDGGAGDTVQTVPSSGSGGRSQKLTWSKTGLSNSKHVVTLRHVGNSGSPASVDFFMYTPGDGSDPVTGGSNGSSSTTAQQKSVPIGPIVGGVVGGVVVIALLALFFLIRARDKREKRKKEQQQQMQQAQPRPSYPAAESFAKEGWGSPAPSGLSYSNATGSVQYSGSSPPPMGAGSSGHTNFSARGYAGYPEAQR